ncbi:hypothetical protein HPB51_016573 [Rhipicephalus microplus]|uniref:CCHC-type domain-containing protein n=1 Tax=Rhipicephalus microplus TaxID=6941 RepID=A0A9J6EBD6_RHIMP|nr:hypothetical protein HPB51_016573 [Rhipicephalus microplus]
MNTDADAKGGELSEHRVIVKKEDCSFDANHFGNAELCADERKIGDLTVFQNIQVKNEKDECCSSVQNLNEVVCGKERPLIRPVCGVSFQGAGFECGVEVKKETKECVDEPPVPRIVCAVGSFYNTPTTPGAAQRVLVKQLLLHPEVVKLPFSWSYHKVSTTRYYRIVYSTITVAAGDTTPVITKFINITQSRGHNAEPPMPFEAFVSDRSLNATLGDLAKPTTIEEVERMIEAVDGLPMCRGGPSRLRYPDADPTNARLDVLGVWRRVDCEVYGTPLCRHCAKLEDALRQNACRKRKGKDFSRLRLALQCLAPAQRYKVELLQRRSSACAESFNVSRLAAGSSATRTMRTATTTLEAAITKWNAPWCCHNGAEPWYHTCALVITIAQACADNLNTVSDVIRHCRTFEALKTRRITPKFGRLANVTTVASVDASPQTDLSATIRQIVREELLRHEEQTRYAVPRCASVAFRDAVCASPPATWQHSVNAADCNSYRHDPHYGQTEQRHYDSIDRRFDQHPRDVRPRRPSTAYDIQGEGMSYSQPVAAVEYFNQRPEVRPLPVCYNCGTPGHIARYCNRRRAFSNGQSGSFMQHGGRAMDTNRPGNTTFEGYFREERSRHFPLDSYSGEQESLCHNTRPPSFYDELFTGPRVVKGLGLPEKLFLPHTEPPVPGGTV